LEAGVAVHSHSHDPGQHQDLPRGSIKILATSASLAFGGDVMSDGTCYAGQCGEVFKNCLVSLGIEQFFNLTEVHAE